MLVFRNVIKATSPHVAGWDFGGAPIKDISKLWHTGKTIESSFVRPIAIIGFGGHAKVVSSALLSLGRSIFAYTCLGPNVQENRFTQVPLYSDEELVRNFTSDQIEVVLGLGSIKA